MATTNPSPTEAPSGGWWSSLSLRVKSIIVAGVGAGGTATALIAPNLGPPPENMDVFNGCGMRGEARSGQISEHLGDLNELKNRYSFPSDDSLTAINFEILSTAKEKTRYEVDAKTGKALSREKLADGEADVEVANEFTDRDSGDIEGYVTDVKPGGEESCNCGATDAPSRDTHIYISRNKTDKKHDSLIVEVTPRFRAIMAKQGVDWSTSAIKKNFLGKYVRVSGWLFFDKEHERNSFVDKKKTGPAIWRASCWEIHPVTDIQAIDDPNVPGKG